jgi:hypothetical protein
MTLLRAGDRFPNLDVVLLSGATVNVPDALAGRFGVVLLSLAGRYGLTYAIGHSADPASIADATGAFVTLEPPQLQSTAFVIDPDGRVVLSLYPCGAIGQLSLTRSSISCATALNRRIRSILLEWTIESKAEGGRMVTSARRA